MIGIAFVSRGKRTETLLGNDYFVWPDITKADHFRVTVLDDGTVKGTSDVQILRAIEQIEYQDHTSPAALATYARCEDAEFPSWPVWRSRTGQRPLGAGTVYKSTGWN